MSRRRGGDAAGLAAIVWTGGMREVPRLGLVNTGRVLMVPGQIDERRARDFIRQGLAREQGADGGQDAGGRPDQEG